jgi:hypothetical protein
MITDLTQRPDEIVEIIDDTDAKLLLLPFGVLDKFTKGVPRAGGWLDCASITTHPTHWISAQLYSGFENPADNGFCVLCLPKSRIGSAQFHQVVTASMPERFRGGVAEPRFERVSPEQN